MLNLGMIGLSPGNGHPYSWSAIFNGYDPNKMADCPFSTIPEYLAKVDRATMGIEGAKVTHIWTQDRKVSEHVAGASLIPNAVDEMTDLIGAVDAVVLARDDGENHLRMAAPFIDAGLPIFIDKPLTDNLEDLRQLVRYYEAGKPIMSCSSMRYIEGLGDVGKQVGGVLTAHAIIAKYWRTHGMHIIEPIYAVMGPGIASVQNVGCEGEEIVHLKYADGRHAVLQNFKGMAYAFDLAFYGEDGCWRAGPADPYTSFRNMLCAFVGMLEAGESPLDWRHTVEMAQVLIAAQLSVRQNGREVAMAEIV